MKKLRVRNPNTFFISLFSPPPAPGAGWEPVVESATGNWELAAALVPLTCGSWVGSWFLVTPLPSQPCL
jgi:hypothetical protein